MFKKLYSWVIAQSDKPYAPWILGIVSFLESSISPIPPDPLLIPMALTRPERSWFLAFLTTATSVIGGFLGYLIGYFLFETIGEWIIITYGLQNAFLKLQALFNEWGFWIIVLKGLTPIPFKVVTITSGVTGLNFITFALASIISRGARFYIEAFLLWKYGPAMRSVIEKNVTALAFATIGALIGGFALLKFIG